MSHEHPITKTARYDQPSEEELRAQLEEELRRITVRDVLLQTIVSLVNLGGQRLGLAPGAEDMRDPTRRALRSRECAPCCPWSRSRTPSRSARSVTRSRSCSSPTPSWPGPQTRSRARPAREQPSSILPAPARRREAGTAGSAGGLWVPPGSGG